MTDLATGHDSDRRSDPGRHGSHPAVLDLRLPFVWLCAAVAVSLVMLGATVYDRLSTDDAMRLVEIRDWLNGQGWYDLVQHRLAPPAGVVMHWSRLIDAAIAALMLVLRPFVGADAAEAWAIALWPPLLIGPALMLVVHMARSLLPDDRVVLPALMLAGLALPALVHFAPGAIDHHNVQIVLILGLAASAMRIDRGHAYPVIAGVCASLSIAVGMEMLPVVVAVGVTVALAYVVRGGAMAGTLVLLGGAMALSACLLFAGLVGFRSLILPVCDAFGWPALLMLAGAGLGVTVVGLATPILRGRLARLAACSLAGTIVAAALVLSFPDCLRAPYADIDGRMQTVWLDHVAETTTFLESLRLDPDLVLGVFGVPAFALLFGAVALRRSERRHELAWWVGLVALAAHFAISLWAWRGSAGALMTAAPVLAAALTLLVRPGAGRSELKLLLITLALTPASLLVVSTAVKAGVSAVAPGLLREEKAPSRCFGTAAVDQLAALPPGRVMTFVDLGPQILARTRHSVFAAPYHRNLAGNGAMFDVMLADPAAARDTLQRVGATYLATCPTAPEQSIYRRTAPDGLAARLERGETFPFLQPLALDDDRGLKAWRVAPGP